MCGKAEVSDVKEDWTLRRMLGGGKRWLGARAVDTLTITGKDALEERYAEQW